MTNRYDSEIDKLKEQYLRDFDAEYMKGLDEMTQDIKESILREKPGLTEAELEIAVQQKKTELSEAAREGALIGFHKAVSSAVGHGVQSAFDRFSSENPVRKNYITRAIGLLIGLVSAILGGFLLFASIGGIVVGDYGPALVLFIVSLLILWFGFAKRFIKS